MSQKRKLDSSENDTVAPKSTVERNCQPEPEMPDFDGSNENGMVEFNDMCDNVIDMILCNLPLKDLTNISDTSTRLRAMTRSVFSRKFSRHLISMNVFQSSNSGDDRPHHNFRLYVDCKLDGLVRISEAKICFKLLRNFGDSIKHLHIQRDERYEMPIPSTLRQLVENISLFCSDSLKTFEVVGYSSFTLNKNKPLEKLEQFCLNTRNFENSEVLELMPNLHTLYLRQAPKIMGKHFAKLKRVCLELNNYDAIQTFIQFLHLNPQIKSLYLRVDYYGASGHSDLIYSSIADSLPQLKTLQINGYSQPNVMSRHHFKTVEKFTIMNMDPRQIFEFDVLKKVALAGRSVQYLMEFAQRNKKLKKLTLIYPIVPYAFLEDTIPNLINELPELEEIRVSNDREGMCLTLKNLLGEEWEQLEKDETGKFQLHGFRKINSKTSET